MNDRNTAAASALLALGLQIVLGSFAWYWMLEMRRTSNLPEDAMKDALFVALWPLVAALLSAGLVDALDCGLNRLAPLALIGCLYVYIPPAVVACELCYQIFQDAGWREAVNYWGNIWYLWLVPPIMIGQVLSQAVTICRPNLSQPPSDCRVDLGQSVTAICVLAGALMILISYARWLDDSISQVSARPGLLLIGVGVLLGLVKTVAVRVKRARTRRQTSKAGKAAISHAPA